MATWTMILSEALVLALVASAMPRIDVSDSAIDWLRGEVTADVVARECVVTGKAIDECMAAAPPSARAAEHDAVDAVLRRVMTLLVTDTCTGYDAIVRDPSLRRLVQSKTRTSSAPIDRDEWRGQAVLRLDVDLARAFRVACAPHVFSAAEEKQLLERVEDMLRSCAAERGK